MRHLLLLCFFLLSRLDPCASQQGRVYGSDKLSSNLITRITQDPDGFIWIGTENGLNKFDGWTFTRYFSNDKDSTSLISNLIQALFTDADKRLWIGSEKGLQYYDPWQEGFHTVLFPDNPYPAVRDIVQLHSGEMWIVTAGRGVFSIDTQRMQAIPLHELNALLGTGTATRIFQDRLHRIWIALSGNRMACLSPDRKTVDIHDLPVDQRHKIYSITEDAAGRIYVATTSNVFLWDEPGRRYDSIDQTAGIRGMTRLKDGSLYIYTFLQGIKYLDTGRMRFSTPPQPPGSYRNPVGERISAFLEDRNGNYWFGYYKRGVSMVLHESLQFDFWDFSKINGNDSFSFIHRDKENHLWAGTNNGTLFQLDDRGTVLSTHRFPADLTCLYEDKNDTFWLGSIGGGLFFFNKKTGKYTSYPVLGSKSIAAIIDDGKNNLYVSMLGEGFSRCDLETKEWTHIPDIALNNPKILRHGYIGALLCDSDGLIWVAHAVGMDCYDPEKNIFLDMSNRDLFRSRTPITLLEDKKKNIWIGTNNGLFKYDKGSGLYSFYGIEDGLPNNVICGLGVDSQGNIWCSTLNGLARIDDGNGSVVSYHSGNGLTDIEYGQNVYLQNNDGTLYFGGLYGITKFMPDSIELRPLNHAPALTQISLNDRPVSPTRLIDGKTIANTKLIDASKIHLSYREKFFSLEFSTMDFRTPRNIAFEYRLIGMSEKWSSTYVKDNKLTFNFLPPGNYMLEVRARQNNRYSPIKSISIDISPPWYLTSWARFIYVLFGIGLLSGFGYFWYRYLYRRHQERINEEKLKFFINIAHELRSPITLIVSPLSELLKQPHDEGVMKSLKIMQTNADRIMNLINQLLDIHKIDKGRMKLVCEETDLVSFIKELTESFDYLATKRNIHFSFEPDTEHLPVWIDRNNFDKVLINLLMNAFKFTPDGGSIAIRLTSSLQQAEISVEDSGIGLNEEEIERIFERFYQLPSGIPLGFGIGLNLTKMLVELHHGTLRATTRSDVQGSRFTVRIPLGIEHLAKEQLSEKYKTDRIALNHPIPWEDIDSPEKTAKHYVQNRILVVDDDEGIRNYLQKTLSHKYKVIAANNGSEAMRLLLQKRIDLIISDVVMPETDGFTLLKNIRGNAAVSHIPVILLTSRVEAETRMKGWDVGADGFLDKPFLLKELLLLCENLISSRSRLKGTYAGTKELEERVEQPDIESNDERFTARLMDILNKNLDNSKFSVEELAAQAGISRAQLHRKIKKKTGVSTSEFIRNIRLKQAAKLVKEKKINISQIAYATGFGSPSIFNAAFKKYYGCTPTEYIERMVEE